MTVYIDRQPVADGRAERFHVGGCKVKITGKHGRRYREFDSSSGITQVNIASTRRGGVISFEPEGLPSIKLNSSSSLLFQRSNDYSSFQHIITGSPQ